MSSSNATKTLILGNGFDLAHFLPTSYSDLITFIKVFESNNGDATKVAFDNIFINKTESSDGFDVQWLSSVNKYYDTSNMFFDLSNMKGKLDNAWLNYFKPIQTIQTWIDFEIEINKALSSVADFFVLLDEYKKKGKAVPAFMGAEFPNRAFFHLEKCKHLVNLKILQKNSGSDQGITRSTTFNLLLNFCIDPNDNFAYAGINCEKVVSYLVAQLQEFIEIFAIYLKQVVCVFSKHVRENLLKKFDYFDEIYSFNYTHTTADFHTASQEMMAYHLHGDIHASNGKNIVLGVNEIDTTILGISGYSFTKYYQTLFNETQSAFVDDEKCCTQNLAGVDYYFWGHSLDKSDERYIKRLFREISFEAAKDEIIAFDWVPNAKGKVLNWPKSSITVYYHNQNSKARLLKNLLDIIGKEIIESSIRTKHLVLLPSPNIWTE